jgi:two-component system, chemotaxis family, chemotaxis protein CheY
MLITRFEVEVSLTHATVADFHSSNARHLSKSILMFIDIDSCVRRPPWTEIVAQPAILYVESNLILSQLVTDMLDLSGWHVRRAECGKTAQIFLRHEQRFALLLVDNELRDMTGLEVVRYARTLPHSESVPIILFSTEDRAEEAKRAGANEFLRKPHDPLALAETIKRLVAARDKS